MNVFPEWDPDETADVEFDQLCVKCMSLFKGDYWRPPPRGTVPDLIDEDPNVIRRMRGESLYQAHHDINALLLSSDNSCHLCSLIANLLSAENVQLLQADLADGRVEAAEQMWIHIHDRSWMKGASFRLGFEILADTRPSPCMDPDDHFGNDISIGTFDLFPAGAGVLGPERSPSVWNCSRSMLKQMISWSTRCTQTHTDCAEIQSLIATRAILPTRLLDLITTSRDGIIRLKATSDMPSNVEYATLSHCWGGRSPKMLTTDSLADLERGIAIDELPRSFRDAALITVELHLAYIWIDTLCIIQDEPDGDDWRHESSIMGDIYANSVITLSADISPNSEGGLIHRRSPLSIWPCRIEAAWTCFPSGSWVTADWEWASEAHMKPLADRAWAFQELLLSKRLLHFGGQIRWQCFCSEASEVHPTGLDKSPDLDAAKGQVRSLVRQDDLERARRNQIRAEYAGKCLTNRTDRLAAFAGIARMMNAVMKLPQDDVVAGLSRSNLMEDLMWVPRNPSFAEHGACTRHTRNATVYLGPSWSWESLEGPVVFEHYKEYEALAEISSVDIMMGNDPFGPIQHASLKLSCALCPLTGQP